MSSRPQPLSSSIEEPSNPTVMEPKETQTTSDGDTNNINSKQDQTPSPAPTLRTSARERKPIRTIGELWIAEQQQLVQLGCNYGGSNHKKNKVTAAVARHAPRSSGSVKAPTKTVPKKTEPTKKKTTIKDSINSQVPGITWRKQSKVFMVRANTGRNKRKYIGQFKTFEEANHALQSFYNQDTSKEKTSKPPAARAHQKGTIASSKPKRKSPSGKNNTDITPGVRGIYYRKDRNMYHVNIGSGNARKFIGLYKTFDEALLAQQSYQGEKKSPPARPKKTTASAVTESQSKKVTTSVSKGESGKSKKIVSKKRGLDESSFTTTKSRQIALMKTERVRGKLKQDDDPLLMDDDYIEEPVGDVYAESPLNDDNAANDYQDQSDDGQDAVSAIENNEAKDNESKDGDHDIATTGISPRVSSLISVLGGVMKTDDTAVYSEPPMTKSCSPPGGKNSPLPQRNLRKRGRWLPLKEVETVYEQDKKQAALRDDKMDDMYESAVDNKSSNAKKKKTEDITDHHYEKAFPKACQGRTEESSRARVSSVTESDTNDVHTHLFRNSEAQHLLSRDHPNVSPLGMLGADFRGIPALQNMSLNHPNVYNMFGAGSLPAMLNLEAIALQNLEAHRMFAAQNSGASSSGVEDSGIRGNPAMFNVGTSCLPDHSSMYNPGMLGELSSYSMISAYNPCFSPHLGFVGMPSLGYSMAGNHFMNSGQDLSGAELGGLPLSSLQTMNEYRSEEILRNAQALANFDQQISNQTNGENIPNHEDGYDNKIKSTTGSSRPPV